MIFPLERFLVLHISNIEQTWVKVNFYTKFPSMRDRSLKIDSNPAQKAILRYQMVAKMDETEQTQSRLVASFSVMTQGLPMKL